MTSCRAKIASPPSWFIVLTKIAVPFLAVLTILFLLLPGVSGPQTGFYWLRVEYRNRDQNNTSVGGTKSDPSGFRDTGDVWDLGGLGVCKVGEECQAVTSPPAYFKPIQQVLQLHLAIAVIFFIISWFSFVLCKFPQATISRRWGAILPLFGPLFTSIVLIADRCIAHALEIKEGVQSEQKVGVLWLRIELAESERQRPAKEAEAELGIAERTVQAAAALWPWKGSRREARRHDRQRQSQGGKSSSKNKSKRSYSTRR
uniref:Uncharacterized protein n=1 Tax=Kwoniella dejecticola CBS 10117 TaxID=1296121 RepID=A0A1A5ZYH6_9TREE|nr:uncharacterized protein I303_06417 [Kwoniella dejecticola CBS 10117]OBR82860.1 hypothetical protein I303_06417 [Kwoniella dejecticola CBS 10117]